MIFAGLALFALALLLGTSAALLERSGEYAHLDDIIIRQKETTGLYGPGIHDRTFDYKLRLFETAKPAVAVLGSSRVLQIRGESFSKPFVNLGGTESLDETIGMAKDALALHKPDLLILGVDFRWFYPQAEKTQARGNADDPSLAGDILKPLFWLAAGKMSVTDALRILDGTAPHSGFDALLRGDGYSIDGSYHPSAVLTGLARSEDEKFQNSKGKIAKGREVSEVQGQKFLAFLDFLQQENVKPIVFLPPIAPSLLRTMETEGGYDYIAKARTSLHAAAGERGFAFFDFHDASSISATDCEFIDGFSGGQVVYLRLLLGMAVEDESLRNALRLPETGWAIENYGKQASLLENEVDFLKLGCVK